MMATLPARPRATYQRRYAPTPNTYAVVWAWREAGGRWRWKVSHYGVNMYGVRRWQFRSEGEGATLRAIWREVRRHLRIYGGGMDVLYTREVGR
jgi:hypothetical protein